MLAYDLNINPKKMVSYLKGSCRLAPSDLEAGSTRIFVGKKDGRKIESARKKGKGVQLKDIDPSIYGQNAKLWHLSKPKIVARHAPAQVAHLKSKPKGHVVDEHPHPTARRSGIAFAQEPQPAKKPKKTVKAVA